MCLPLENAIGGGVELGVKPLEFFVGCSNECLVGASEFLGHDLDAVECHGAPLDKLPSCGQPVYWAGHLLQQVTGLILFHDGG